VDHIQTEKKSISKTGLVLMFPLCGHMRLQKGLDNAPSLHPRFWAEEYKKTVWPPPISSHSLCIFLILLHNETQHCSNWSRAKRV